MNPHEAEVSSTFLEIRTATVLRTLVPVGGEVLDFGEIPVAFKKILEILIKNHGEKPEVLSMESLTPFGGFTVLNALRAIGPGETKPVVI